MSGIACQKKTLTTHNQLQLQLQGPPTVPRTQWGWSLSVPSIFRFASPRGVAGLVVSITAYAQSSLGGLKGGSFLLFFSIFSFQFPLGRGGLGLKKPSLTLIGVFETDKDLLLLWYNADTARWVS
ncbi:hypothetical protein LZ31DRAFT_142386 [Colletotrichum somersetense]|nr:hypothetical protein LZ31DRAFT_142386 [Colletotrichum somersetense]